MNSLTPLNCAELRRFKCTTSPLWIVGLLLGISVTGCKELENSEHVAAPSSNTDDPEDNLHLGPGSCVSPTARNIASLTEYSTTDDLTGTYFEGATGQHFCDGHDENLPSANGSGPEVWAPTTNVQDGVTAWLAESEIIVGYVIGEDLSYRPVLNQTYPHPDVEAYRTPYQLSTGAWVVVRESGHYLYMCSYREGQCLHACPTADNPDGSVTVCRLGDRKSEEEIRRDCFGAYGAPLATDSSQSGARQQTYSVGYDNTTEWIYNGSPTCEDMNSCPSDPTCTDGVQNGNETGVDCGGSCPACTVIPPPTCTDGVQNGDETGVDCGGSCPACETNTCVVNGQQDGDEEGVDCGPSCEEACDSNSDSQWCQANGGIPNNTNNTRFCCPAACGQCGGPGCGNSGMQGQCCIQFIDPRDDWCDESNPSLPCEFEPEDRQPVEPTCDDGVQNGDETGVDCGGSCGACGGASQRLSFWNASWGKYIIADNNGGSTVHANRDIDGPHERFTMTSLTSSDCIRHNDTVTIRTSENWYWVALENGGLHADRTAVGPWERFVLVNHSNTTGCLETNDEISLRSHWSRYVVAEPNGDANVNRENIGPWERFRAHFEGQRPQTFVHDQVYHIQFRRSGKWLDLSADGTNNGDNVQQWAFHGRNNQRVRAFSHNDGWFTLRFLHSNRCVDGNQGRNNENLYQWDCHMGNNQRFRPEPIPGTDMVLLRMNHGGHCMDQEGHGHDGGNVKQWHCAQDNTNQQVRIFLANPN